MENYLAGRGIALPAPPSLRWAAHCWHDAIALSYRRWSAGVRDVDGQVLGVHRTYLMRDDPGQWHRRERASLGLIGGRAVQLGYAAKMLIVAELLYSIRGAQKVLGLSRASIYRFIYGGDLATIKIGRRTAVSAASVQRLAVEGAP